MASYSADLTDLVPYRGFVLPDFACVVLDCNVGSQTESESLAKSRCLVDPLEVSNGTQESLGSSASFRSNLVQHFIELPANLEGFVHRAQRDVVVVGEGSDVPVRLVGCSGSKGGSV